MTRTLRTRTAASTLALSLACLLAAGCHVSEHKNGNRENVDIGTPFGSMQVKTNDNIDTASIGFAAYPGAVPIKDQHDKDSNSANVDMNFGNFHLGVKAATFQTSDSQDKVLAFYRKDLASRYGDVIECRGNSSVGTPDHTAQGLTCDEQRKHHISITDSTRNNVELRSGSEQHQHIVGLEDRNGGTKIGLVSLDLPSHLLDHDSKDSE